MGGEDWFFTGDEAEKYLEVEEKRRAAEKKRRDEEKDSKIYRFYLPVGGTTHITFVDDLEHPDGYKLPFVTKEHQRRIRGDWKNWFTCLNGLRSSEGDPLDCPLCEIGDWSMVVSAYTIIDHSKWQDKRKTWHQDEVKLFAAKTRTKTILDKYVAKYGSLRGLKFEVSRSEGGANVGDTFIFDEQVELKDDIQPVDYKKVFAPLPVEEIKDILGIYDEEELRDEGIRY